MKINIKGKELETQRKNKFSNRKLRFRKFFLLLIFVCAIAFPLFWDFVVRKFYLQTMNLFLFHVIGYLGAFLVGTLVLALTIFVGDPLADALDKKDGIEK